MTISQASPVQPDQFAHPVDEPCPPGCPTRLDEIASYLASRFDGYAFTGADVAKALDTPASARLPRQQIIAMTADGWV